MNFRKRALGFSITILIAISIAMTLYLFWPQLVPESSPVARGTAAANSRGCIDCHGKPGAGFPDDAYLSCSVRNKRPNHLGYDGRCDDALAYFEVVRLKRTFRTRSSISSPNRLLQGEILARQYNCFQCHGELGQGGFHNDGALKGYIPGYFGGDFALLTRDGNMYSVRAWISQGIDPALLNRPIEGRLARFFIERQKIGMPVYASLPDSTIRLLAEYVVDLHRRGPMNARSIREYDLDTRKTSAPGPVVSLEIEISDVER